MAWKWFSEKEVEGLNYDLVAMLDKARDIADIVTGKQIGRAHV